MSNYFKTFAGVFVLSLFAFSAILSYADNINTNSALSNTAVLNQSPPGSGLQQGLNGGEKAAFPCGDVNSDGNVDILDIIYMIDFKFKQGPALICPECNCSDGIDNDGDGFADCDDLDCQGTPACPETNCADGIDNDGDGFTDCDDLDCDNDPACGETVCNDGVDNDGDGFTDCDDLDCVGDPNCPETNCSDGTDNDGDGFTDCEDNDCIGDPFCAETNCTDGVDNDGDGFTDCDDLDCANDPNCP